MIEKGQIRRFKNGILPNIKISFYNESKQLWCCVFQEDFKFPYIHLSEDKIESDTELIKY